MKKMKLLITFLVVMLGVIFMSFTASAETDGYYTYEVTNDEATITDVNETISGDIIIPDTLGGYPVTKIGDGAFYDCNTLSSVIISDCIKIIGDGAFGYCKNIQTVIIPDSVKYIGSGAFRSCRALNDIFLGENIERIGWEAFYDTGFYNDKSNWLDGVLYKDRYLISWDYNVFDKLEYDVKFGTKLIADYAFSFNVIGPEISIESINIPNTVIYIGENAFYSCETLKKVSVPSSVTKIGKHAFDGCYSLEQISVDDSNDNYLSENGILFDKDKKTIIKYPATLSDETYSIPDGVKTIGSDAFGFTKIKKIYIPNSVTVICEEAFFSSNVSDVEIPNSVKSIGSNAFAYCDGITNITIGTNLTTIDDFAFFCCRNLSNVYYLGSKEQWKSISIGSDNYPLINAKIHYNSVAHTHNYVGEITAPTCTAEGYTTYTCSCGETYTADETEATGHSYKAVVTEPTCTAEGYTTYTCSCGDTYTADETEATGHTYVDDNICDNCGERKECSCNCHKTGIAKLFFNIFNFFRKLFGQNKFCVCGAKH